MAKILVTESALQDIITESVQNVIAEKNLKELNEDYSVDLNKMGPPEGGGNSYYNDAMQYNGGSFNSEKGRSGLYNQLAAMGYSQQQIVRGINSGAVKIGKIKNGNFQDRTNTGAKTWWGRNIWGNNARKSQRQMDRLGRYASRQGDSTRSQDIEAIYGENEQLRTQNQELSTQVNNYQAAWSQIAQEIDKVIALYTPAQKNPNESRTSKKGTKVLKEEEAGANVTASSQTGEAVEGLKNMLAKIAGIGKQITTLNGQLAQERRQRVAIQQQLNNANASLKQYQQNTANAQAGAQQTTAQNQTVTNQTQQAAGTQTAGQGNAAAQTTQQKTQLKEQWKKMLQRMDDADL
jgi:hypothetical protein